MAFIISLGNFISFAEYADVVQRDQRLFEANEGLTESEVEDLLEQASNRLLSKFKASDWWRQYQFKLDSTLNNDVRLLPALNPLRIKSRQQDFTDLCVYYTLHEYILPKIADFANDGNSERQKILYYKEKSDDLFNELLEDGSWYDYDNDGTVETTEKMPARRNLVRVR